MLAPTGHRLPPRLEELGPRAGLAARAPKALVITVIVVAFLASIALAVTGRPPALIPRSGAERYVAPDGHREILAGPRTQIRETAHQPGNRAWTDGPVFFYLGLASVEEGLQGYWIVETEGDGAGGQPHLMELTPAGLRTRVTGWPEPRSFTPGRPEVPADPRAGQRLTTTGRTTDGRDSTETSYTSSLEVLASDRFGPGCLEFRRTDTIGAAAPVTTSRVRCPDRGVVALTLTEGTWTAVDDWPAGENPAGRVDLDPARPGPLRGLGPTRLTIMRGQVEAPTQPAAPVEQVGNRLVVAGALTGNIAWLDRRGDRLTLTSWADVGGDIVTVGRCGEVVVAATSRRRLVAQDRDGGWIWTSVLDDVAGSRPTRSANDLLVATKDGRLSAVGCADGAVQWVADDIGATVTPAVGAAGVLAAGDRSARMLDPATGATRWERRLPAQVAAVAIGPDRALAADEDGRLHAFDPATGEPLWSTPPDDTISGIHLLGDITVRRTTTALVAHDATGARAWRHVMAAHDSLDDGSDLFAADLEGIVVLDRAGRVVERVPQPMAQGSTSLFLTRTSDGVIAADLLGTLVHWRRA